MSLNRIRRIKVAAFAMMAAGMVYSSACSVVDVRHNVVAGTQSFVRGYTTDFWEALIPAAVDLFNRGQ